MVKRIKILSVLLSLGFLFTSAMPPKCNGDDEFTKGMKQLSGFKLIKDYRVSIGKSKADAPEELVYPVSLTKGLKYKFVPVNNEAYECKLVMTLYLNKGKEMKVASTYRAGTKKHYPSIEFQCGQTGTFYLHMYFDQGAKGCAVGLFAVSGK